MPYISASDFDTCVSANGSCRCFGWDGAEATVFKVPKLNDVYIEAGTAVSAGEFISESLPNITGKTWLQPKTASVVNYGEGAFYSIQTYAANAGGSNATGTELGFDASRSSSAYQNNAKVHPDSVRYRVMIQLTNKTTDEALLTVTGVEADIGQLKANKANSDLSNCTRPYIMEFVSSGTNGCKVYSNGFKEQWGYFTSSAVGDSYVTVNLIKPFSDTNYFVMNQQEQSSYTSDWGSGCASIHKTNKTLSSFELSVDGCTYTTGYYWFACGY